MRLSVLLSLPRARRALLLTLACLMLAPAGWPLPVGAQGGAAATWTVTERHGIAIDGMPVALSPDGQWIAGIGPERRQFCVWAVADLAATCNESEIVPMAESIAWAPDSSAVAYGADSARFFDESDIMVFDIATMTLRNLTDDPDEQQRPSLTGEGVTQMDVYPAWAPDSTSLVFVRSAFGGEHRATRIMHLDVASGVVEPWFTVPGEEPFSIYSPMLFEPDGSLLVAIQPADLGSGQHGIWRIGPGGKGIQQVLAGGANAAVAYPQMTDLSADGTRVALFAMGSLREVGTSPYGILDLATGEVLPMPGPDAGIAAAGIYGWVGFAGDTDEPLYLLRQGGDGTFALAAGREEVTVLADALPAGRVLRALDWSDTNIVMVPGPAGEATLLTLAAAGEATPAAG